MFYGIVYRNGKYVPTKMKKPLEVWIEKPRMGYREACAVAAKLN